VQSFWLFAKKFLEKGVFFFASFLLDERNEGQVKITLVFSQNSQMGKTNR
jgi:hypothetical protein